MDVLKYFPPVIYDIPDINHESILAYSGYNNPFTIVPSNELLNYLRQVRHELNTEKNEENFIHKIYYLEVNWGPPGLNILKPELIMLIQNYIQEFNKNELAKKRLVEYAFNIDREISSREINDLSMDTLEINNRTDLSELFNKMNINKSKSKSKLAIIKRNKRNK